jgi:stage II sporulation protein D
MFRETAGVSRIDVLAVSRTGRIRRARVIGPAGSLELSGAELRQRLGLRSTLVKAFRLEPVATDDPAPAAGAIGQALLAAQPWAGSRAGIASKPLAAGAPPALTEPQRDSATGAITSLLAPPPPLPAPGGTAPGDDSPSGVRTSAGEQQQPTSPARPTPQPALELVVEGRGFGHGVGMSQWGAYAMALQGRSYDQILRHYYRGVELKPYPTP